jgi:hypothetical protein
MIKNALLALFAAIVIGLFVAACTASDDSYSNNGSSSSGGSSSRCSTGNCLNNGQCCPKSHPNYTYGGHGYAAGCYQSCPYVGDCGSTTQCF